MYLLAQLSVNNELNQFCTVSYESYSYVNSVCTKRGLVVIPYNLLRR